VFILKRIFQITEVLEMCNLDSPKLKVTKSIYTRICQILGQGFTRILQY